MVTVYGLGELNVARMLKRLKNNINYWQLAVYRMLLCVPLRLLLRQFFLVLSLSRSSSIDAIIQFLRGSRAFGTQSNLKGTNDSTQNRSAERETDKAKRVKQHRNP